ncbi:pentatricopeptide repeat-containing protein-like [Dorcoceras hygrometricum]|uniref:Pentatricopeptide repeat-containing protein-like n=1 Tax=Dorcoceras hygrometricum TaxID=472368 RepID=A0A2Z7AD30_9LAMI|nr:pentatricopeptide repeat-containing protein-like [Dorcoceras hygrometricum]
MKSRVQAHNDEVQNGSGADQVQSTSVVFKCRCIDKRSDKAQHEDQLQRMKSRVQAQNDEVQIGSSADQVLSTSAVFKCRCIEKRNDHVQIYQPVIWEPAGNGEKLETRSSSRAGKNRTSSAAEKRGADVRVDAQLANLWRPNPKPRNHRPSSPLKPPPPPPPRAAARLRRKIVSGQLDEENPFVQNSSVLLVQADEGVSVLVVDRNFDRSDFDAKLLAVRLCSGVNAGQPYCSSLLVELESAEEIDQLMVVESVARAIDRYDDVGVTYSLLLVVVCVAMVAADQQAHKYEC